MLFAEVGRATKIVRFKSGQELCETLFLFYVQVLCLKTHGFPAKPPILGGSIVSGVRSAPISKASIKNIHGWHSKSYWTLVPDYT